MVWGLAAAATAAGAGLTLKAYANANRLTVERYDAPLPGLAAAWHGLTILHLSDAHGRTSAAGRPLSRWIAELAPDLIAITGDLVEHRWQWQAMAAQVRALSSPLGVYYVTGNHEWSHGAPWVAAFKDQLQELGVTVLSNDAVRLEREDAALWLAGVDDPITGHARLDAALPPAAAGEPIILLAHAPDVALDARIQRCGLVLAGHTHGGQICFPSGSAMLTNIRGPRAWMSGEHNLNGTRLIVSRGIGTTWLPLRLNCPAELALIRLQQQKEEEA